MSIVRDEIAKVQEDTFGFRSISESIKGEKEERLRQVIRRLYFGIKFMDDTLRGIDVDDFLLIGAAPGIGKTEFATAIALKNARAGKRVYMFALEAGRKEIERRMKFNLMMKWYIDDLPKEKRADFVLLYYDWFSGAGPLDLEKYEDRAEEELSKITNLKIFYRTDSFGIKDFHRAFSGVSKKADLVLVDHLHYFTIDDDNENKAFKEIMMEMRDLVLINQVPIVLIAHLRKADRTALPLAPELTDFHGTSEIGKIVTKAVTLGPGVEVGPGVFETFIRVAKCRQDGTVTRFMIKAKYDASINSYKRDYDLGYEVKTRQGGMNFEAITDPRNAPAFIKSQKHYGEKKP